MRPEVREDGTGVAAASAGRALAAAAVVACAASLLSLPLLAVFGVIRPDPNALIAGLGAGLVAVTGGGKVAAVAWGLGNRFVAPLRSRTAAARVD